MSVVIETTLGDLTVDLYLKERPRACLNFLKLCKIKYYNYNLFHTISRGFIAQTGDPTGSRKGGESIFGVIDGEEKRYFAGEKEPRMKHTRMGLISFVGDEESMVGSQFFLTLGENLNYLDQQHCVFGELVEGLDVLEMINEAICDTDDSPYQDVRITHTVVLDDPFPDPVGLPVPSRSPSPSAERLRGGRIAPDEEIDEAQGKSVTEVVEMQADREAKARATILEMVGDIPDAEMAPPENVLFVCKLNPVTSDDDLEVIFNRFGKIKSCEVIRDRKTGDSLQYAFIEFEDKKSCEDAYFKMDNILIDDRRIHVDFSQSVSKMRWLGKGRGVTYYDNPYKPDEIKQETNRDSSRRSRPIPKRKTSISSEEDYQSSRSKERRYRDRRSKSPSRRKNRRNSVSPQLQHRKNHRQGSKSNREHLDKRSDGKTKYKRRRSEEESDREASRKSKPKRKNDSPSDSEDVRRKDKKKYKAREKRKNHSNSSESEEESRKKKSHSRRYNVEESEDSRHRKKSSYKSRH